MATATTTTKKKAPAKKKAAAAPKKKAPAKKAPAKRVAGKVTPKKKATGTTTAAAPAKETPAAAKAPAKGSNGGGGAAAVKIPKEGELRFIPFDKVNLPKGFNPRSNTQDGLAELTANIKKNGQLSPGLVVPSNRSGFDVDIVAGERRYWAAKNAGLKGYLAMVRERPAKDPDATLLAWAIAENSEDSRTDLPPLDKANAFKRLVDAGYTIKRITKECGFSDRHVSTTLQLLEAPKPVKDLLATGGISRRTALAVAKVEDPSIRKAVLSNISEDTTEREVKAQIRDIEREANKDKGKAAKAAPKKTYTKEKHAATMFQGMAPKGTECNDEVERIVVAFLEAEADYDNDPVKAGTVFQRGVAAGILWARGQIDEADPEGVQFLKIVETIEAENFDPVEEEAEKKAAPKKKAPAKKAPKKEAKVEEDPDADLDDGYDEEFDEEDYDG